MKRPRTIQLGIAWICVVVLPVQGFSVDSSWDEMLAKARRHQGTVWCGVFEGKMQAGSNDFVIFGYEIVKPNLVDLAVHLFRPWAVGTTMSSDVRFLRITESAGHWSIQDNADEARTLRISPFMKDRLKVGLAFTLSSRLIPGTGPKEIIVDYDHPEVIRFSSVKPIFLLPTTEGMFRLTVDRRTGIPKQLIAFGLDEWFGVPSGGYKLMIKFRTFPGCRPLA